MARYEETGSFDEAFKLQEAFANGTSECELASHLRVSFTRSSRAGLHNSRIVGALFICYVYLLLVSVRAWAVWSIF